MSIKYSTYDEIPSIQDPLDAGEVAVQFVSDQFWTGRCIDPECANLHVLMRSRGRLYEVAATFSCEQLEDMLNTARLIRQRLRN